MTKLGDIKWDKEKLPKKKHLGHEDKQALAEYYQAGLKTGKSSEDLLAELEERYGRSSRQIQRYIGAVPEKHVQSFEQKKEIPSVAERTRHEEQLRAMISYLVNSLLNLKSFIMPSSPQSWVLPYDGQTAVAGLPIEKDPVFQALMEHLKDTDIPKFWKDAETARREYFVAIATHHSVDSSDPEFVRKEQEKIEALHSRGDELWQRYSESTFSLWQKLKELLLLDKLPGKCHLCSGG